VDVARDRLGSAPRTSFVQADVMHLPFRAGSFDTVFSEGVLHHTPSTRDALREVLSVLRPGGQALFYVYRRKGPVRELADDHLRDVIAPLDPEAAWDQLRPLTKLARALSELRVEVDVPEDVALLGIAAGRYDVQRLVYWHFAKLFWNDELSFEENVHVNFDWYHPRYAHRQSEEEVLAWCREERLTVDHLDVQESGITVRATKG
jgi:SAM-dependent methyltransferase